MKYDFSKIVMKGGKIVQVRGGALVPMDNGEGPEPQTPNINGIWLMTGYVASAIEINTNLQSANKYNVKIENEKIYGRISEKINKEIYPDLICDDKNFKYSQSGAYGSTNYEYVYDETTDSLSYYIDGSKYPGEYTRIEKIIDPGCFIDTNPKIINTVIAKNDSYSSYLYFNTDIDMYREQTTITTIDGMAKTIDLENYQYFNWLGCYLSFGYKIDDEMPQQLYTNKIEIPNTYFDNTEHTLTVMIGCMYDNESCELTASFKVDPESLLGSPTIFEAVTNGTFRLVGSSNFWDSNFKYKVNDSEVLSSEWTEATITVSAGDIIKAYHYSEQNGGIYQGNFIVGTNTTAEIKIKSWSTNTVFNSSVGSVTGDDRSSSRGLVEVESWEGLENVTSMDNVFNNVIWLRKIPDSWAKLSNVESAERMFQDCTSLKNFGKEPSDINLLTKLINVNYMFQRASNVESGLLNFFNTLSTAASLNMSHVGTFYECGTTYLNDELQQIPIAWRENK